MPTYKNNDNGTWYCKFNYTDWTGKRKQKLKRGFNLQREAKEWERIFLEQFAKNPDITFESLYLKYKGYIEPRIKESTYHSKFLSLDKHVLPFFKDRIISDIGPADIAAWQNEMLGKGLSDTYLHNLNSALSSIFNYAVDYVGLPRNPCKKLIGSNKTRQIDFWTPDEYKRFSDACRDDIEKFTIFETLYYTGMRKGELMALTLNDIDFKGNKITINKTYYQAGHKTTTPKTHSSNRVIDIPEFLTEELREYVTHLYQPDPESRLFIRGEKYLRLALNSTAEKAGIKRIRVHDIRHSHASLLIDMGANPVLIAARLGHESADITLKIYSHLFPTRQADIVQKINNTRK